MPVEHRRLRLQVELQPIVELLQLPQQRRAQPLARLLPRGLVLVVLVHRNHERKQKTLKLKKYPGAVGKTPAYLLFLLGRGWDGVTDSGILFCVAGDDAGSLSGS